MSYYLILIKKGMLQIADKKEFNSFQINKVFSFHLSFGLSIARVVPLLNSIPSIDNA